MPVETVTLKPEPAIPLLHYWPLLPDETLREAWYFHDRAFPVTVSAQFLDLGITFYESQSTHRFDSTYPPETLTLPFTVDGPGGPIQFFAYSVIDVETPADHKHHLTLKFSRSTSTGTQQGWHTTLRAPSMTSPTFVTTNSVIVSPNQFKTTVPASVPKIGGTSITFNWLKVTNAVSGLVENLFLPDGL